MDKVYAGLDVGSSSCHLVAENAEGGVLVDRRFTTSEANLVQAFSVLKGEIHVHLETCELAPWVRRVLKPHVTRVVVGHAKTNAWIFKDPRKCDRVDAKKLAELLRMGQAHEVYYSEDEGRLIFKQIVQAYESATRLVVRLKQKVKSQFRQQGVIVRGSSVYGREGREKWLSEVRFAETREVIRLLYATLDQAVESHKKALDVMVRVGKKYPEVARLDTVPGIGPVLACCFAAYIQDPNRFSSRQDLWRYCGLGVTQKSSDGKPLTHKCLDRWSGNPKLKDLSRKAFLGIMLCRKGNAFRRAYEASLERTQDKVHARLNVQRKILATLRAIWKGGTTYKDEMGEDR